MGQNGSRVQDSTPDIKLSKLEDQPSLDMNENKDKKLMPRPSIGSKLSIDGLGIKEERESIKATQMKLGVNIIEKDAEMPVKMESFIIDAIIIESLKQSGNENAIALKKRLEDQFGGSWNVLIRKTWVGPETGYCFTTKKGSNIFLTYQKCAFTIFKSR